MGETYRPDRNDKENVEAIRSENLEDLCTGCRIILQQILEKYVTVWTGLKILRIGTKVEMKLELRRSREFVDQLNKYRMLTKPCTQRLVFRLLVWT
jgi:hypothetical protein